MLTSPMSGMVGDERIITDSSEHLRKETEKSDRFGIPRLDSFHMETTGSTAELPSYSFELEMAPTDGGWS
jgi:hypothetical protein